MSHRSHVLAVLAIMMFVPVGTSIIAADDRFAALPPLPLKLHHSRELGRKVILRKAGFEEHVRQFVLPEGMRIQVRERLQLQTAKVQREIICADWVVVSSRDEKKLLDAKVALAAAFPGLRLRQNGKGLFRVHAPAGQDPIDLVAQIKPVLPAGVDIQADGALFPPEPKPAGAIPPAAFTPQRPQGLASAVKGPIVAALPNDAATDINWWVYRTGADRAWDITTGSRSVIIGVVDFGFNPNSPDLKNNYWTNPLEIPGNGIDDDGNGLVDDTKGWNFGTGQKDVFLGDDHGQHVAGIIGAEGNNGLYQCGMNWKVSILPLQIGASWSQVADAFHYAAKMKRDYGHNIVAVNASLGGGEVNFVKDAVRDMESAELLLVAAAGNYGENEAIYPARWSSELSNVLSVGAIEGNGGRSGFSNFSSSRTTVDVAAPETAIEEGVSKRGTSMASPMVAGAVGLLASLRPGLKATDYRNIINLSSRPNAGWATLCRSGGELDVPSAINLLSSLYPINTRPTISVAASVVTNEDVASSPIPITISDAQTAATTLILTAVSSNIALIPNQNLVLGGNGANRTLVISPVANQNGQTTVTVTVSDGSMSAVATITVTVNPMNDAPVNTTLPVITGTAQVGQTLNATIGIWNDNLDSGSIAGYAMQWQRANDTNGNGLTDLVTTAGYTAVAADLGKVLRVRVTATDAGNPAPGRSTSAVSAWTSAVTAAGPGSEVVWVEDAPPLGSQIYNENDGWNWISSGPTPYSGAKAHQTPVVNGLHQHFFTNVATPLAVPTGATLFAYIYLDTSNPPTEIMLQWNNGSWDHRAFWGADQIGWGKTGTSSRRSMGALPALGQWVRLEVPASLVGLEGATLNGMAFTLYGGRATWDKAGVMTGAGSPVNTAPTITAIKNVTINEDSSSPAIPFTITDAQTSATALSVSAVPTTTLVSTILGGSGENRTVTLVPAANQSGSTTVTVTVSDGTLSTSNVFSITVNPVNDAPVNTALPIISGTAKIGQTLNRVMKI